MRETFILMLIFVAILSFILFGLSKAYGNQVLAGQPFRLVWTPASGTVAHYNIYRSTNGGAYIKIGTTTINSTLTALGVGQTATYIVEAENISGCGPMSDASEEIEGVMAVPSIPTLHQPEVRF